MLGIVVLLCSHKSLFNRLWKRNLFVKIYICTKWSDHLSIQRQRKHISHICLPPGSNVHVWTCFSIAFGGREARSGKGWDWLSSPHIIGMLQVQKHVSGPPHRSSIPEPYRPHKRETSLVGTHNEWAATTDALQTIHTPCTLVPTPSLGKALMPLLRTYLTFRTRESQCFMLISCLPPGILSQWRHFFRSMLVVSK